MGRLFHFVLSEIRGWLFLFVLAYPDTTLGTLLRRRYWSGRLKRCGTAALFRRHTSIGSPQLVEIGDHFAIGEGSMIGADASKGIYIGNNVMVARGTYMHAANHKIDNLDQPISQQGYECRTIEHENREFSIVIEDGVWIGSNVVIVSGAKIGRGTVVSAGSVVSGEVPPYSIIVGNPGKRVMSRKKILSRSERPSQP